MVQTEQVVELEHLFKADYAYFSGYSSTWVDHCRQYVDEMVERLGLNDQSHIVEVASNDGTLLRCFQDKGLVCTGIEPTASTATAARALGLTIVEEFLSLELAERLRLEGMSADLVTANNVLAHVPDIRDFAAGCATLLASDGVATFEFPHVVELVTGTQFDTIYHEHFSYLSLVVVEAIFSSVGLVVVDVERIPSHGGSLRVFAQQAATGQLLAGPGVDHVRALESEVGVETAAHYRGFQDRTDQIKTDFLEFLLEAKNNGLSVAAYGAAAKGNTLLNYAGVRPDLVSFVADRNPVKQGMFLPGSRIPIVDESEIERQRPDYVVILPWNLSEEITGQLDYIRDWSGSFITAIPELIVW